MMASIIGLGEIMRAIKTFGAVGALLFLMGAGCATDDLFAGPVQTKTIAFHNLPGDLTGKKFYLLPMQGQQGTPEFNLYAQDIAGKLTAKGMVQTMTPPETDYVLMFSYSADNGRAVVNSIPVYDWTGGGTSTAEVKPTFGTGPSYTATVKNDSSYEMVGQRTVTETVYKRNLEVRLAVKPSRSDNPTDNPTHVYQGSAMSEGSAATFAEVSRCIINALLDDFPGVNGRSASKLSMAQSCKR